MKARILLLLLLTVSLQACSFTAGVPVHEYRRMAQEQRVEPTLGEELMDLDRARSAGALTEAEYQEAKARILKNVN